MKLSERSISLNEIHLRLSLNLFLRQTFQQLWGDHIMPFPLPGRALSHSSLEGFQLCKTVQTLDGGNSLFKELCIWILFFGLLEDSFQQDGIFL
jgi:hypothetical protein